MMVNTRDCVEARYIVRRMHSLSEEIADRVSELRVLSDRLKSLVDDAIGDRTERDDQACVQESRESCDDYAKG